MLSSFAVGLSDDSSILSVDLILPVEDTSLYGCVFIRLCLPIKEPNSEGVGFSWRFNQINRSFLKNRSNFLCNYTARLCSPSKLRTYFISSADLVSGAHSTSNLQKHPQELISCISADSFICACSLFSVFVDNCSLR